MININKPTGSPRINGSHPLARGLVGFWLLNEGAGLKALDFSGLSNHGALTNGPTWGAGRYGKAVSFDGSNDYIEVQNSSSLQFSGAVPITISVLFKPAQVTGYGTFLVKGRDTVATATNYALRQSSTGKKLDFYFNQTASAQWHVWTTTNDVITSTDVFYHVVVRYLFGTGSSIAVFVNGLSVAGSWTTGTGNATADVDTQRLSIGCKIDAVPTSELFSGLISDVRIYNRILSSKEIIGLYVNPYQIFNQGSPIVLSVSSSSAATEVFDGKIIIKNSGTNLLDGKMQVKDVVTAILDGKVIVKDSASWLLDGKVEITFGAVGTDILDGSLKIKSVSAEVVDGKIVLKTSSTNACDGKIEINQFLTSLLDAKVRIRSLASDQLDGSLLVIRGWIIRTPTGFTDWGKSVQSSQIPSYGKGVVWGEILSFGFPGVISFSARFPKSLVVGAPGPTTWDTRTNSFNDWVKRT